MKALTPAQAAADNRIPRALAEPDNRSRRRRNHYGVHPKPKGKKP